MPGGQLSALSQQDTYHTRWLNPKPCLHLRRVRPSFAGASYTASGPAFTPTRPHKTHQTDLVFESHLPFERLRSTAGQCLYRMVCPAINASSNRAIPIGAMPMCHALWAFPVSNASTRSRGGSGMRASVHPRARNPLRALVNYRHPGKFTALTTGPGQLTRASGSGDQGHRHEILRDIRFQLLIGAVPPRHLMLMRVCLKVIIQVGGSHLNED